jgi:putative flippase GtrA
VNNLSHIARSRLADPDRRKLFLQAARYAVAGLVITIAFSASYWAVTEWLHLDPMLSLLLVFLVFSAISFVTHGRFSFDGHGERDRPHVRLARFVAVNVLGLLVNQFWVWLLVKQWHGATWWPTIPFIFVTPWLTFSLNRRWVYA